MPAARRPTLLAAAGLELSAVRLEHFAESPLAGHRALPPVPCACPSPRQADRVGTRQEDRVLPALDAERGPRRHSGLRTGAGRDEEPAEQRWAECQDTLTAAPAARRKRAAVADRGAGASVDPSATRWLRGNRGGRRTALRRARRPRSRCDAVRRPRFALDRARARAARRTPPGHDWLGAARIRPRRLRMGAGRPRRRTGPSIRPRCTIIPGSPRWPWPTASGCRSCTRSTVHSTADTERFYQRHGHKATLVAISRSQAASAPAGVRD